MKVIGITGPTGAGKTTALNVLREMGCEVIDADEVYHGLLGESRELKAALIENYGETILDAKGAVNSHALAEIVYPDLIEQLNELTWPFVTGAIEEKLARCRAEGRSAAIDAIALVESGLAGRCDTVVAILAPLEVRVERIMARDAIDESYARRRIEAQKPNAFYMAHSDYVLENREEDTPATFAAKARALYEKILAEG